MNTTRNKSIVTAEPGKQDLFITREFDAPPELVFRAFTDPDWFVQWMGPRQYAMELVTFEPREGGRWRYISRDDAGNAYGFHGVFHTVSAPDHLIQTFEFEGLPEPGHVVLEAMRLEALPGGRTRIHGQSVFLSVEDRDGMIQSGMEEGMEDGYRRLDELLAKQ